MSSTLWDPANLLQITDSIRDQSGKINCVGVTRYNARCKWTLEEPDLSEIRPLLERMSQSPPGAVGTKTLRHLAKLCLCSNYHSNQVETFVSHWSAVVMDAVQHQKNMLMVTEGKAQSQVHYSQAQAYNTEEVVQLKRSLDAATQLCLQIQEQHERDMSGLQDEIRGFREQLQETERRNESLRETLSVMKDYTQLLEGKAAEDSLARERLEDKNAILRARWADTQRQLDAHTTTQEQNNSLSDQVAALEQNIEEQTRVLQITIDKAHAAEQQLSEERTAKESMSQKYTTQLGQHEAQGAILKSHAEDLEIVVAQLEAGISACWWHRFRTWVARLGKDSRSRTWIGIKDEGTEDIALKTYA